MTKRRLAASAAIAALATATVAGAALGAGCSASPPPPADTPAPLPSASAAPAAPAAVIAPDAVDAAAPAAPDPSTRVALGSDANGLFWNDATGTLLVADDDCHIRAWKDDGANAGQGTLSTVAELPAASVAHAGLGQPVQLADGTIVVPRFGGGTDGGILVVHPDHTVTVVKGLDKTRRRLGLTVTGDGKLFDTYFVKGGSGPEGAVARVDLHGKETDVVPNLKKPVGVLATATALLIADQEAHQLVTLPYPFPPAKAHAEPTVFASMASADLLAAGPDGSFFTGGRDGIVRQIDAHGQVREIVSGFHEVRGVAFDAKKSRLFFVDHETPANTPGGSSTLVIRPL